MCDKNSLYDRGNLRSQALDLLRFPLAVVIVFIHVSFYLESIAGRPGQTEHPLLLVICRIIKGFFADQVVPIYYFISGFVFFLGIELTKEKYIQKLKNRVKSLLIPYLVWNTIAVLMIVIKFLPFIHGRFFVAQRLNVTFSGLLSCYWRYDQSLVQDITPVNAIVNSPHFFPINEPLWFVRDLMIVVLFTPVIWWILRHTKNYVICLVGILWLTSPYFLDVGSYNLLTAVFFFSFGAYMSIGRKDMPVEFGRYFKISMIVYPALGILYVVAAYFFPDWCLIIIQVNIFAGLLFAYNIAVWLLREGRCRASAFLSSASFFVYVSHSLLVVYFTALLGRLVRPSSDLSHACVFVLSSLLIAGFLLAVFWLLRRYCPAFLKVIAGRK